MEIASRLLFLAGLSASLLGCQSDAPPPARVDVPADTQASHVRYHPQPKPVYVDPPQADIPLPIDDPPLITQAPAEQTQYLEAYERVGRPRIVVFVNRTVDGSIINTAESMPMTSIRTSDQTGQSGQGDQANQGSSYDVYLPPGTYDEAKVRAIDYEAIELVMGDLLAANGRVKLISPSMARNKLTDSQIKQIQSGEPVALRAIAETLSTDVLIQVQARPTRQTKNGLDVRVLAEAIDVATGQSLARAFVDVPPPLTKTTLQKYSRYLSRKLMYNLAGAWRYVPNSPHGAAPNPEPVPNPTAMPTTPKPIPEPPPTPKNAPASPSAPDQPSMPKN